ncbi:M16 family metallopeptidase [Donghicola mangrovi]|uniref:Insulinase family protein n=1 Tax=Donghicola mangrovi TaxID=2729614 RepID=A0A850Q719_9RHOB|nr:insulinase family protein [Donghicola mangrovi]NVO25587.1 insulinase family protein [Donghicola mangrovi]
MFQTTRRVLSSCALILGLAACKDDNNRVISSHVSPAGHAFQLMPITEKGVTDIMVSAAWATDWLNNSQNNTWVPGLAAEMMLSGGTDTLSSAEVLDLLDDKNAYGHIGPASDLIYGEVEFPNNHRNAVLPVLADLFQRPVFDPGWFDRIIAQTRDQATQDFPLHVQMWQASRYAIFGETPQMKFLSATDLDALDAVQPDDLRQWHKDSFAAPPVALVVTGAVNVEDAGEIIDTLLPPPSATVAEQFEAAPLTLPDRMIYLHDPAAEKSILGFLGTLSSTHDGMDGIDLVAANLFAAGAGSPLFDAIRTDLGASYGMSMELLNYSRLQRGFVITGEIDTAKMRQAQDAVLRAYADFRAAPGLDGLEDTTQRIADNIRQNMVYVSSSATMIRELLLDGRDPQDYHSIADDLAALTAKDVAQRLQSAFPQAGDLAVFAAGPDPQAFPDACVITAPEQALECR